MKRKSTSKIIISWIATGNDFKNGSVNKTGPNYAMHRFFYTDAKFHLLLHAETGDPLYQKNAEILSSSLKKDFKDHTIQLESIKIGDVISLNEILPKVSQLLLKYEEYEIDLFISPGTPMMQVAWVMTHLGKIGNTRLIQSRRPEHSKNNISEFFTTEIIPSAIPYFILIKENSKTNKEENEYIETGIETAIFRANQISGIDNINTLITGETGTGKEGMANLIHSSSSRKSHPFITINCSAFSDELLGAELFGSVKGAFTGAVDRKGLFETANGGTVFLDEIGDISPKMQQSLLRVLQNRTFMRLGETKEIKTDVRIITATNKRLEEMSYSGLFRSDLFYRLNQTRIHLPALFERGENAIKQIVNQKSKERSGLYKKPALHLNKDAWSLLTSYRFPGNIRELENIIDELYIFKEDENITSMDLSPLLKSTSSKENTRINTVVLLKDVIRNHCKSTLEIHQSKAKTIKALGISINTLNKYLED
ncbi:MAG: sigma-54-dependent Fis family transcriptional regulator [Bacteroidetes bacterium]|nr:sigma-54-dependent Fis family transcriptional regulator [Bacteroidota bacterium]